jgi:glycosyltransferase involved in cell wall biosynthesis
VNKPGECAHFLLAFWAALGYNLVMPVTKSDSSVLQKKITVVIPAFHEEAIIGAVVAQVSEVLKPYAAAEILVIDDGSPDETGAAAARAGARVIRQPYNKGNGAAIKTGIRNAQGDIIVFMDGDGQHDPADIPRLVAHMDEYEMVIGARSPRSVSEWHRRQANRFYNILATYICGTCVLDLTSGFRAVRADLARKFCHLLPNRFSYPSTMTIVMLKAGYSVRFVTIDTAARVGTSKVNLMRDGVRFFFIIVKVATLFEPLKIFLPIGLLVLLPGAVLALYRLIVGRPWTLPIVISVSVGVLIIVLGLISEQIALLRTVQFDRD